MKVRAMRIRNIRIRIITVSVLRVKVITGFRDLRAMKAGLYVI